MGNCRNCGAPMNGGKCSYCGTENEQKQEKKWVLYRFGKPVEEDEIEEALMDINSVWIEEKTETG